MLLLFVYILLPHLLQDGDDLLEGGPLAGVLVHADPDQLGHVRGDARGDLNSQALGGNLSKHNIIVLNETLKHTCAKGEREGEFRPAGNNFT